MDMNDPALVEIRRNDHEAFTAAGYSWVPAGGGLFAWQRSVGELVIAQIFDWHTEGPGQWHVAILHDDGSMLAAHDECTADVAVCMAKTAGNTPRSTWRKFAASHRDDWQLI